jgi:ElaB/YqjD/DUF883 family membrane-anchored ribosome-binding protein
MLKAECAGKSESSLKFYTEMRKEVLDPLNEVLKQLEDNLKDVVKSIRNNRRKFTDRVVTIDEAYSNYNKAISDLDEIVASYNGLVGKKSMSQEEKSKYSTSINQTLKTCKDNEIRYKEKIYAGRDTRIDYVNVLGLAIETFKKEEDQRIDLLKKTMLGILKHEQKLGGAKIEAKIKLVESIEQNNEIMDVINRMGTLEEGVESINFKKPKTNSEALLKKFDEFYAKNGSAVAFNYENAVKSIQSGVDDTIDEQTQEIIKTLNKYISACWDGKGISAADTDLFTDLMKDKTNRKLFCECMNQYRRNGIFSMTDNGYKHVSALFKNVANAIETAGDISAVKSLIILSETYYYEQKGTEGSDRIYLQQTLTKHKYFHSEEFWKQMIEEPFEEVAKQEEETEEEKQMREVNEVFSRLGTYAHNMLQFEMDKKVVEDIILTYADKKNLPKPYKDAIQVLFE